MKVNLKRINKAFHYEASTEEKVTVNIDANSTIGGEGKGTRPMELLLMGVAGCASIDLGLILKKQKQELTDYNVEVTAERNDNVAKNFKSINLHFILYGNLDDSKVERAIELTLTKYCSVALSLDKKIEITSTYEIK
ncbi:MAG: OsmC family protein [Flavobacteriales bacterium]|nr:OsmC family protein [Flavobacteriales bacterium]